jgi:hypothetical protein
MSWTDSVDLQPVNQNPNKPLSEQQRLFVRFFVHEKMNQTAAARAAGYKEPGTRATALMKLPQVQKAIADERAEYRIASGMTRQKVIDGMQESIDMARGLSEPMTMIAGWREIGRICGLYEPTKAQLNVSVSGSVMLSRLQTMSDAELLHLATEQQDPLEGEFKIDAEEHEPDDTDDS